MRTCGPAYLADYLSRLKTFFHRPKRSKTVQARLERIEAGFYGNGRTRDQLHNLRTKYLLLLEIDTAKKEAIARRSEEFRH